MANIASSVLVALHESKLDAEQCSQYTHDGKLRAFNQTVTEESEQVKKYFIDISETGKLSAFFFACQRFEEMRRDFFRKRRRKYKNTAGLNQK